jgi:ankyrin repeat protein
MDSSSTLSKPATQAELNSTLINAIRGHDAIDTVKQLISAGADVNAEDERGNSALSCAAKNGHLTAVNALLPHIDLNSFNKLVPFYIHPIELAACNGHIEVVLALLPKFNIAAEAWKISRPDDFQYTRLACLGNLNHPEIIKVLTTVFSRFSTGVLNSWGEGTKTALHTCASKNWVTLASVLIALKADVNMKDYSQETPLMHAAQKNQLEIIPILIKAGADISALNYCNCTALTLHGCKKNTKFLLLSTLPLESILLQKQSESRHVITDYIKAVNQIRDTLFHTLFALQTREKTSLPNESSTLVISYLEQPEWYDHRFNADIQAMLKRVGTVLDARRPKKTALLAAPAQTFLPTASSNRKRGVKRSSQSATVTVVPVEDNAASGRRYPKRKTRFEGPYPK